MGVEFEGPTTKPSVFEYADYRRFLDDCIVFLKSRKLFNVRSFAKQAKLGSSSYLRMVINGSRNMRPDTAIRIAEALQLSSAERRFFENLVLFNQAHSLSEKNARYQDLLKNKKFQELHSLSQAHYDFYSCWWTPVLYEALSVRWSRLEPSEMAKLLRVKESEIKASLETLMQLKLIEKRGKVYQVLSTAIETRPEFQSLVIRNFHAEVIGLALKNVNDLPMDQRDLGCVTIALSTEAFEEIKKKLWDFRHQINLIYSNDKKADRIYQLNTQLFPVCVLEENLMSERSKPEG